LLRNRSIASVQPSTSTSSLPLHSFEGGAVIAGGDDAPGDAVHPRVYALRASQRFPLRAKSSRQAQGRPQDGSAFADDHFRDLLA
jgi:hypothetical protein